MKIPKLFLIIICLVGGVMYALLTSNNTAHSSPSEEPPLNGYDISQLDLCTLNTITCESDERSFTTTSATVTAYTSRPEETQGDPCISASGDNICLLDWGVAACPRDIPLGTWIGIDGRRYQCLDRTSLKYDGRYDLYFKYDLQAALQWGKQIKEVKIYD